MFEDAGPASEDAGPRPNQRGWRVTHPAGIGHPRKVMHARLIVRGKLAAPPPGDAAAPVAARPERKAQHMRMGNKGPHGRPWIWLMAVIVICLAPVMDPIAADITVTALAVWAMRNSR